MFCKGLRLESLLPERPHICEMNRNQEEPCLPSRRRRRMVIQMQIISLKEGEKGTAKQGSESRHANTKRQRER